MDGWIATGSDDVFADVPPKRTPTNPQHRSHSELSSLLSCYGHSYIPVQHRNLAPPLPPSASGRVLTKILILPRGLSPLALIYRPTHVLLNGPTNFNVGEIGFEWGPAEFRIPISRSSSVVFRANSKAYITHYIPKVVLLWNVLFIRSSAYTPLGMMRKAHGLNILLWAYYN